MPIEKDLREFSVSTLLAVDKRGTSYIFSSRIPHSDNVLEILKKTDKAGYFGGMYRADEKTPQVTQVIYSSKSGVEESISWEEFVSLGMPIEITSRQVISPSNIEYSPSKSSP